MVSTPRAPGHVVAVPLPPATSIARLYPTTDLADAYCVALPAGASTDPEVLARFMFAQQPRWATALMALRDTLVRGLGLKTTKQLAGGPADTRVGIFRIHARDAREIVLGEDDRHLDFRLSVHRAEPQGADAPPRLTVSTVVHCHNRLGRGYLRVIAPFHRAIVQSTLRRAAHAGWPRAEDGPPK